MNETYTDTQYSIQGVMRNTDHTVKHILFHQIQETLRLEKFVVHTHTQWPTLCNTNITMALPLNNIKHTMAPCSWHIADNYDTISLRETDHKKEHNTQYYFYELITTQEDTGCSTTQDLPGIL
jgi:hypothetical protein